MNYVIVFLVSFVCIALELFWTRVLNLKAWNHVVYTVIPFAILGYGIGANLLFFFNARIRAVDSRRLLGVLLIVLSGLSILVTAVLIRIPLRINDLLTFFTHFPSAGNLLAAYSVFMLPFVVIGFMVVYLFEHNKARLHWLYAVDLAGAGLGAIGFFVLISRYAVMHSIFILALLLLATGLQVLWGRRGFLLALLAALIGAYVFVRVPEPADYLVDTEKNWEFIPGTFTHSEYSLISSRWSPLGRTEIFRISDPKMRQSLEKHIVFTFELNVTPRPEFSYFVTNYLSGSPVFKLGSTDGLEPAFVAKPFSVSVEAPYRLFTEPPANVMIIGAGGGRDIFIARQHGAKRIIGAEINPEIHRAMSSGGEMYEYSGRIYDQGRIENVDARHLVKTLPAGSIDYIVLNGVDTFSGLSSGAYAYAESYLYTVEAVKDYLRVLSPGGVVFFNRWLFHPPRESLRLQAIVFQALLESGFADPRQHCIIAFQGGGNGGAFTMVRKDPFTPANIQAVNEYLADFKGQVLIPVEITPELAGSDLSAFPLYSKYFMEGKRSLFESSYAYDVAPVRDDNPFFYKYYKFDLNAIFHPESRHHTGSVVFFTQFLLLGQALVFILIFIFFPLHLQRRQLITARSRMNLPAFVLYFACLGTGYMFFEIPLMQQFVLLLGSPIHSISVILSGLLIFTGVGSLIFPCLARRFKSGSTGLIVASSLALFLMAVAAPLMSGILEQAMMLSFPMRIVVTLAFIAPVGMLLGFFFPAGLQVVTAEPDGYVMWAWGINCGFSVLGSILAIILAQYIGFNAVILLAGVLYLTAALSFRRLLAASGS